VARRARVVMSAGTSVEDQSLKQRILEYLKATGDWVPLFTIVKVSKKWDATKKRTLGDGYTPNKALIQEFL
jgi:hypothetical protein